MKILDVRYVSIVSGPRADTDCIHCIWTQIQWIQYVLYLIVSEVEADTTTRYTVDIRIVDTYRTCTGIQ